MNSTAIPRSADRRGVRTVAALLLSLALVCAAVASEIAPSQADGPYIVHDDQGRWQALFVDATPAGLHRRVQPLRAKDAITVPAVGNVPAFRVQLRAATAEVAPDAVSVPAEAPVFVVADTHGQFEILVEMLRNHAIVDRSLRWSFGRGHLVFLGDVFDRGPNQTEILWLIYQLEAEAAQAGGGVHLVLGNHEAMVLLGEQGYLHPKYPQSAEVLGASSYAELFGTGSVLGQWLRTKATVLKVGDLLCLHGGISADVVARSLTLAQLNEAIRETLSGAAPADVAARERMQFVMGRLGPMWYRGYFADQKNFPAASSADVDRIREYFGVSRILIGHTTVPTVTPLYDGRVIAVQVYPHLDQQTGRPVMEAVRIDQGRLQRARIDGTVELLATGKSSD